MKKCANCGKNPEINDDTYKALEAVLRVGGCCHHFAPWPSKRVCGKPCKVLGMCLKHSKMRDRLIEKMYRNKRRLTKEK